MESETESEFLQLPKDCLREIVNCLDKSSLIPFSLVNKSCRKRFFKRFKRIPDEPFIIARDYLAHAAEIGSTHLMEWAAKNGCFIQEKTLLSCLKGGNVDTIRWLVNRSKKLGMEDPFSVIQLDDMQNAAFQSGSEEMWDFFRKKNMVVDGQPSVTSLLLAYGVQNGDVKIIEYCYKISPAYQRDLMFQSIRSLVYPDFLTWMERHTQEDVKDLRNFEADLDFLKVVKEKGGKWGIFTCQRAAEKTDLQTLQYALEHSEQFEKEKVDLCNRAIRGLKLDNLRFLMKEGYPVRDPSLSLYGADPQKEKTFEMIQYFRSEKLPLDEHGVMYWAGSIGNIDYLKWGLSQFGEQTLRSAGRGASVTGQIDAFKWVISQGEPLDMTFIRYAATNGRLSIIKWMMDDMKFEGGFGESGAIFRYAATEGSLRTIQYLHSKGYKFHWEFYSGAASNGKMHILNFAKNNGFKYEWTKGFLFVTQNKRVLQWEKEWKKEIDGNTAQGCTIS